MLEVDLADVSITETYRRVKFGISGMAAALEVLGSCANYVAEPRYQNDTQFPRSALLADLFSIRFAHMGGKVEVSASPLHSTCHPSTMKEASGGLRTHT